MKNYTISSTFFADVLQLDQQSQHYVLSTCQQLADSDEQTVEQYELPADAPGVLADFVKRLKRRIRGARRRRERPAAPQTKSVDMSPDISAQPTEQSDDAVAKPRTVEHAVRMFEVASAYVLECGETFDLVQLKHIYKLVSNVLDTFRGNLYLLRKKAISLAPLTRVVNCVSNNVFY